MPLFIPSELSRAVYAVLAGAVLAAVSIPQAQAAAVVSGQGTWETTLQGRDLDGDPATFEAYYDTVLNITWLANANYAQYTGYNTSWMKLDRAKEWVERLNINGVTGWRLPEVKPSNGIDFDYTPSRTGNSDQGFNITSTQSELSHLYYVTMGNSISFTETGVPINTNLKNSGPFIHGFDYSYWTSSEYKPPDSSSVWYFGGGVQSNADARYGELFAWPVRSGDISAAIVPEPTTYASLLIGLTAMLAVRRRRFA